MLLKERKLGDPRTDNGCKEDARSTMIGDRATDATDGRRAICGYPKTESKRHEQTRLGRAK